MTNVTKASISFVGNCSWFLNWKTWLILKLKDMASTKWTWMLCCWVLHLQFLFYSYDLLSRRKTFFLRYGFEADWWCYLRFISSFKLMRTFSPWFCSQIMLYVMLMNPNEKQYQIFYHASQFAIVRNKKYGI